MLTKCIKIPIEYSKDNLLKEKDFFNELRELQYKSWKACNRALTYFYTHDMQNIMSKENGEESLNDKELYGKTYKSWIENRLNEIMDGALSNNVAQTMMYISNRYYQDKKNGLFKGNVRLSQVKRNMPIIIHAKAFKIACNPKGMGVQIGFFNLKKQNELGAKRINFMLPKIHDSEKAILNRLMDKSYKQGAAQIVFNERKNKWLIAISFSFEEEKISLDKNLVMGIDLGITKVVAFSIYDMHTREYIKMKFNERFIDGEELVAYRRKQEARRKALYIASKWSSKNNIGHGYKTKLFSANKIGDKYNRFKDTFNHKVSKFIIETALKYGAGSIQMEKLSGFNSQQSESLLKNWSYFDLQNKIMYKAKEVGINVYLINPQYTSQRCNRCGYIDSENRDCKKNQAEFKCKLCGYTENADINASMNICIPDIEEIIKNTLKSNNEGCFTSLKV